MQISRRAASGTPASTSARRAARTIAHIPSAAWKTPIRLPKNTIGDTPSERAASTLWIGSTRVVEMAKATATPTTPHWSPTMKATRWQAQSTTVKRKMVRARSRAISTSVLRLCSAWTIPTQARIWITGIAASHWLPRTTGTKSGATTTRPVSAGTQSAASTRATRAHEAAIRSGWSWMRQKAGDITRCNGPPSLLAGCRMVLKAIA